MKDFLKRMSYGIARLHQLNRILMPRSSKGWERKIRVLTYHHIPASRMGDFEEQIQYLMNSCSFIDMNTFLKAIKGAITLPRQSILLTFDDGYKSAYDAAQQVLRRYDIKAVFFVVPEFAASTTRSAQVSFISNNLFDGDLLPDRVEVDMRPMSWDDIKALSAEGHTIGAHTSSHCRVNAMGSFEDHLKEMVMTKAVIESSAGSPVKSFALPFGDISSIDDTGIAKVMGNYDCCFASIRGYNYPAIDPYALRREAISLDYSPQYVQYIVEGGLDAYYYMRRRKLDACVRRARKMIHQ